MDSPPHRHVPHTAPCPTEVLLFGNAHCMRIARPVHTRHHVDPVVDHPGGCYTCRWFGHRVEIAVWCARPAAEHHRSQAHLGCACWERETASDDELTR